MTDASIANRQARLRALSLTFSVAAAVLLVAPAADAANYCPAVWKKAVLPLNFNPAFTSMAKFNMPSGGRQDGLLVSSFFNALKDPTGTTVTSYFERDLIARIGGLDTLDLATFNKDTSVEVLTDLGGPPYKTNWPNNIARVPDGVVPFEAVVSPQGFLAAIPPGRLSLINLDSPSRTEYIVHQSTSTTAACNQTNPARRPRFYHEAQYADMDGDGYQDIVTVRSSFKPQAPGPCVAFNGDLVYYKNPGPALNPTVPWVEHILFGLPATQTGPDLSIKLYDFENDGVPEVVATHFFNRGGAIRIYGAPVGMTWGSVNQVSGPYVREEDIVYPGRRGPAFWHRHPRPQPGWQGGDPVHQPPARQLLCRHPGPGRDRDSGTGRGARAARRRPTRSFPGRTTGSHHVLKDDIRPNPTYPAPTMAPGRLAPGGAVAFTPVAGQQGKVKPWIVVGGDEASKVWLLSPKYPTSKTNWDYCRP